MSESYAEIEKRLGDMADEIFNGEITSRLQKGGALLEDMRLLVCHWTDKPSADSPLRLAARGVVSDLRKLRNIERRSEIFF